MSAPLDTGLSFYRQVLDLRAYRQEVLTADIANASTPGFKAIDLDFQEALSAATAGPSGQSAMILQAVDPRHLQSQAPGAPGAATAAVKYQVGAPVTLDGNSVDLNQEKVAAAENAVQYQAAASFASRIVRMLTVAISGAGAQSSAGA